MAVYTPPANPFRIARLYAKYTLFGLEHRVSFPIGATRYDALLARPVGDVALNVQAIINQLWSKLTCTDSVFFEAGMIGANGTVERSVAIPGIQGTLTRTDGGIEDTYSSTITLNGKGQVAASGEAPSKVRSVMFTGVDTFNIAGKKKITETDYPGVNLIIQRAGELAAFDQYDRPVSWFGYLTPQVNAFSQKKRGY